MSSISGGIKRFGANKGQSKDKKKRKNDDKDYVFDEDIKSKKAKTDRRAEVWKDLKKKKRSKADEDSELSEAPKHVKKKQDRLVKKKPTPKKKDKIKIKAAFCAICYRVQLESNIDPNNLLFICRGECGLRAH